MSAAIKSRLSGIERSLDRIHLKLSDATDVVLDEMSLNDIRSQYVLITVHLAHLATAITALKETIEALDE